MLAPGFNRWGQVLLHFGTSPFEDSVKAVSGEISICARCDFPHREAREQALLCCTQTTRSNGHDFFSAEPESDRKYCDRGACRGAGRRQGEPPLPPPAPHDADDDFEDGDIATPARDRHGNDDEPL